MSNFELAVNIYIRNVVYCRNMSLFVALYSEKLLLLYPLSRAKKPKSSLAAFVSGLNPEKTGTSYLFTCFVR
jgi:hypothetical protein